MNDEGINDSAILLLSIGEEQAAEVFKYLTPSEVQRLGQAMAKLNNVSRDKVDTVLDRFHSEAEQNSSVGSNSDEYIRSVLTKALGEDKANMLLDRILQAWPTLSRTNIRRSSPRSSPISNATRPLRS
jgi:flagellar motor switch protein FliG